MAARIQEIKGSVLTSGGDIGTGNNGNTIVGLQGVPIATTPPTDGQVLTYVAADSEWKPETPAPALNFSDEEVPGGALPGTAFTLAHAPSPVKSLQLFRNGVLQMPGAGNDYTLSGLNITTSLTWAAGDNILAWYRY